MIISDSMKKFCYTLPQKSISKDYFYNMVGSISSSAFSLFSLVLVSYLTNEATAGVFSLAYSVAQMMYIIGVFEMRNIQVTDSKREFNFANVLVFRIITVIAMLLYTAFFLATNHYSKTKVLVIALLTVYMAFQALSDVFQGVLHLNGYLYLSGISMTAITGIGLVLFCASLFITRNLYVSLIPVIIFSFLWILFFDIPFARNFSNKGTKIKFSMQKMMFFNAFPLFLSSFLQQYIFNYQKFAIEDILSDVQQAHYGYLVMPAFFINLLSLFVFRPQLVVLSEYWRDKKFAEFKKKIKLLYGWIFLVMVGALICAYFLGIPVIEMLYNTNLAGEKKYLLLLLVAGAFSAGCSLTATLLTVIRKQKYSLVAYVSVFIVAIFVPKLLVSKFGMAGACFSYLTQMFILFAISFCILLFLFVKNARTKNGGE